VWVMVDGGIDVGWQGEGVAEKESSAWAVRGLLMVLSIIVWSLGLAGVGVFTRTVREESACLREGTDHDSPCSQPIGCARVQQRLQHSWEIWISVDIILIVEYGVSSNLALLLGVRVSPSCLY
jgi:hypothetical protein